MMMLSTTLALTLLICFEASFSFIQAKNNERLPAAELHTLRLIANDVGKKDWNFTENPCNANSSWNLPQTTASNIPDWYINGVSCDCKSRGPCHITGIYLQGQDLVGVLPRSLSNLTKLAYISLSGNYLRGTIPSEWASMQLTSLFIDLNLLSGPIPGFLGNITTLSYMNLHHNQFTGKLPAELGKLAKLQWLDVYDNYLMGNLPYQLSNLTMLKRLCSMISSNNFTGKLPNFESWPYLEMLEIQGTGLQGPLPASISALTRLNSLIISDLNGGGASQLPYLRNLTNLLKLVLRSCYISGPIPEFWSITLPNLEYLDLSFNNIQGEIPDLDILPLQFMYLTSNSLTGPIPDWIKDNSYSIFDLSYNNFDESSVPSNCRDTLNLYRSFRRPNTLQLGKCLSSCSKKDSYSFHINCGGQDIQINNTLFEGDEDSSGPAKFVPNPLKIWGTSSTGSFRDTHVKLRDYVGHHNASNSTAFVNYSDIYTTARLSPLSLTYYGRCLANGNYTVTLHFMEIMFTTNQSWQSIGRRLFDVYIQDQRELVDFDITQEANGVGIPVKKNFTATVNDKILEIRFQYTGKGTSFAGKYGPLISAISVEPDFKPPEKSKKKMFIETSSAVLGIFLIVGVISFFLWDRHIRRKISREEELRGLDLRTGFTHRQIKAATNNFDAENRIGKGGFGYVYKGTLLDGTLIAVKQLYSRSSQGNREFLNEMAVISALRHPNLVKLYGCCIEERQLLLVYEYMKNNSLARALFGPEESQLKMDWPTRQKICTGIARGLVFMHEESLLKIVHRDIKADNILLDEHLNAKISDFGLAKLDEEDNTHISTKRVAGTTGYMAPEYALWGYLTFKADVYSFGVVLLEIIAGKCNMKYRHDANFVCLLDWALVLQKNGSLMDLVDPKLGSDFNKDEVEKFIRIALMCTSPSPALRPTMSEVVKMLQGDFSLQEFNTVPVVHDNESNLQSLRLKYENALQDSAEYGIDSQSLI